MKRLVLISAIAVAVFAMTSNVQAQETDINMTLTVDEYIEATPSIDWNLGTTSHTSAYGPSREQISTSSEWDIAYANCPFNVTIEGDNPAGDGIPRFAKEEEGANANGYDQLPSFYKVNVLTNGVNQEVTDWWDNSGQFPLSKDFTEAPHNGQVHMSMGVKVNSSITAGTIPIRATQIDPSFSWEQSADAGVYKASMVATFSAL